MVRRGQFTQIAHCLGKRSFALLFASSILLGCGPELEPISDLKTLRILGVRKSAPYARPGEKVDLKMLWEDGRSDLPEVETFFAFFCMNPPADLYSQCLAGPPKVTPQFSFGETEFSLSIPDDALRGDDRDSELPDYGTVFVMYGVCAGTLTGESDAEDASSGELLLPGCVDDEGQSVGSQNFILGYSTIFVFEELRNENPLVKGFVVGDEEVEIDCVDEACEGPMEVPDLSDCQEGVACFEACPDDGDFLECPEITLGALIDEESAEADSLALAAYDRELEESIWVSYFVDRGRLTPPLKLVNDADLGWRSDFSTKFYAPAEPGPLRLWAVVRDSRGGSSWTRLPAFVKAK